jgi:protein phosphatase
MSAVMPSPLMPAESADGMRSASTRNDTSAMPSIGVEAAVASLRGKARAVNEDSHSPLGQWSPLFVVADGVGGGALASRASRELVTRLHEALDAARPDAQTLRDALVDCDRTIARSIASRTTAAGAATVAVCACADASWERWLIAWVGDCRVYRLSAQSGASAQLLTVDDTYRHLREAPPPGGSLDDPARMVGNGAVGPRPNVRKVELRSDEMLVLCSDGVHRRVAAGDIGRLLRGEGPLAERCRRLVRHARASGSDDDATVLVVHRTPRREAPLRRLVSIALLAGLAAALLWLAAERVSVTAAPYAPVVNTTAGEASGSAAEGRAQP